MKRAVNRALADDWERNANREAVIARYLFLAARVVPGFWLGITWLNAPSAADAATLRVPQSYATIQKAINSAQGGDVVLVTPGTYSEQLELRSSISISADTSKTGSVFVVGPGNGSVITCDHVYDVGLTGLHLSGAGQGPDDALILILGSSPMLAGNAFYDSPSHAVLALEQSYPVIEDNRFESNVSGITLREGSDATVRDNVFEEQDFVGLDVGERCFPLVTGNSFVANQTGIYARAGAAPEIRENIFLYNVAYGLFLYQAPALVHENLVMGTAGEGLYADRAQANIQHNHFDANGGGVVVVESSPIIAFNTFTLNTDSALLVMSTSYPSILHNIFQDNKTAIRLTGGSADASPHIFNNTLVSSQLYGIHCADKAYPAIDNNIVAYHKEFGIFCEGSSQPTLAYNLFYGNGGTLDGSLDYGGRCEAAGTDIHQDPLFVAFSDDGDPTNDDLHLQEGSAAIDAGNPQPEYNDVDGSRNDMGVYGGPDFPAFVDMDGDGYTSSAGDCNDANAHIYPGASELDDDLDNDCDGAVDEGLGEPTATPDPHPAPTDTPEGDNGSGDDGSGDDGSGDNGSGDGSGGEGTPEVTYGEGCNCRTPGGSTRPSLGALLLGFLGGSLIRWRRGKSKGEGTCDPFFSLPFPKNARLDS